MISRGLLALLLLPCAAHASSVIPQSADALTRQATHVLRAVVESQREGYDERARHATVETTFTVSSNLKGDAGRTVVVRQLKGIPGDARFRVGEEAVLFLRSGSGPHLGVFFILGLGQGKFEVTRPTGRPALAERDFSELSFVAKGGGAAAAPERSLALDELERVVRRAAGGGR